jgi:hypothetical protein
MEFHYDDPRQGETLYKFCDEQAVEVLMTDLNVYDSENRYVHGHYTAILYYTGTICLYDLNELSRQFTRKKPD